jgi:outer membrane protein assembly factor BamD
MRTMERFPALCSALALVAVMTGVSACGSGQVKMPALGSAQADEYLFTRGTEALAKKHWYEAHEYFRKLVESYPQSSRRQEAKLGLGDSLLGLKNTPSDILAINEFREFLQYFPLNPKADYALYQICKAEYRMVYGPERDQTATVEALKDINLFLERYQESQYRAAVVALRRQAMDRLSDHEFDVGMFYFKQRTWGGAMRRFTYLLQQDPEYTRRDAAYYYWAESVLKGSPNDPQSVTLAKPTLQKIIDEFPKSKYAELAKKRLAELGNSAPIKR